MSTTGKATLVVIAGACIGHAGAHASAGPVDDSIGPVLFYRQPAKEWVEALPIGNGRLGGMVFGGVPAERIQLNEDTFWSGGPYDPISDEALQYLPKVRQLLWEGRYKEAQDLADEKLVGRPRHLQTYQPLGDLRLVMEGHEHPTDYRRELDLDRAVVRVRYRIGETTFTREVFSSAPDQAIVVRLTAEGPGRLSFTATLDSKQPFVSRPLSPRGLLMSGRWRGDLDEPRGPPEAVGEPARPLVRRRARVRRSGLGRRGRRTGGGRPEGTARRGRFVRDPSPGRGHELQGTRPRGGLRGPAPDTSARTTSCSRDTSRTIARSSGASAWTSARATATSCPRMSGWRRCARERSTRVSRRLYFQYGRYLLIASSRPGTPAGQPPGPLERRRRVPPGAASTRSTSTPR